MHVPTSASPWHAGEQALQARVGLAERLEEIGSRIIRPAMPEQHQVFFALLHYVVVGAVDASGDAWATLLTGRPGFLHPHDPKHLAVAAIRAADDPADGGLDDGASIGLLGIDLATRRRNRLNGTVRRADAGSFVVDVQQSFGNCPQYIRPRRVTAGSDGAATAPAAAEHRSGLDADAIAEIGRADTFFVASYVDTPDGRQVDVSHRGGPAGFVHVDADGVLTIPDYSGNMFFNTLGNLVANPRAGLAFVDFATGGLLQLTGDAEVLPDDVGTEAFRGAERLWRFTPRQMVRRPRALPLHWGTGNPPASAA